MSTSEQTSASKREPKTCTQCHGQGFYVYGSTSTWHRGIGGAAMTNDVCDKCWGTGYESHPGPNRRRGEHPTYHVELIWSLESRLKKFTLLDETPTIATNKTEVGQPDELSKAQARIRELEVAQKGNLARLDQLNATIKAIWEVLEIPSPLIFMETANNIPLRDFIKGLKQENNDLRKLTMKDESTGQQQPEGVDAYMKQNVNWDEGCAEWNDIKRAYEAGLNHAQSLSRWREIAVDGLPVEV